MIRSASLLLILFVAGLLRIPSARAQDEIDPLATQAKAIIQKHCHVCHGSEGSIEGGVNYILDVSSLVARRKLVPGDASKSPLWKRIEAGEMPPDGSETAPSDDEKAILKKWIAAGAASFTSELKRDFITNDKVLEFISDDLSKADPADRQYRRYFSITHLYNAGLSDDELQTYRNGLAKLVNSLSWNPKVKVPQAIDEANTVLQIDLRDYSWNQDSWLDIIDVYPYGVMSRSTLARRVYRESETTIPVVRGDWFVASAAQPPLYHDLLRLPRRDWLLERQLEVDVEQNIAAGSRRPGVVARAGFNGSGVSRNNRLIERHDSKYGAYWKSYDFAGNSGRQNLFAHPLGPDGAKPFQHAGGEIIFSLPNGLQAYFLTDEDGRRIDKGPTEIVSDPRRPDRAVVNGLSCMSCHARGIIFKDDQVREHVTKNTDAFAEQDRNRILNLYPGHDAFRELLKQDAEQFQAAVEQTGAKSGSTEPIVALALRFERELDLKMAAAEAGVAEAAFVNGLKTSALLSRRIGALNVEGGSVQRQVFVDAFLDVINELNLGSVRDHAGVMRRFDRLGLRIAFSPDGQWLAFTDEGNSIRLCDAESCEEIRSFERHPDSVRSLAFSPDGEMLVTSCEDSHVRIWNVDTGKLLHRCSGHKEFVFTASFSADGRTVLSAGMDGLIRVWNVASGKQEQELAGHDGWIRSVACSADGREWVSAGNDGTIIVWDAKSQDMLQKIEAHRGIVTRVVFVPGQQRRFLSGGYDNVIRLWESGRDVPLKTLIGHSKPVTTLAVSPDGKWLASCSRDNSLRVWDLKRGGDALQIHSTERMAEIQFAPGNSNRLGVSGGGDNVRILGLPGVSRIVSRGFAPAP